MLYLVTASNRMNTVADPKGIVLKEYCFVCQNETRIMGVRHIKI